MAIVHFFIALVTLTPQVPHLIGTLHARKWLALLALGQTAGLDMTTLPGALQAPVVQLYNSLR